MKKARFYTLFDSSFLQHYIEKIQQHMANQDTKGSIASLMTQALSDLSEAESSNAALGKIIESVSFQRDINPAVNSLKAVIPTLSTETLQKLYGATSVLSQTCSLDRFGDTTLPPLNPWKCLFLREANDSVKTALIANKVDVSAIEARAKQIEQDIAQEKSKPVPWWIWALVAAGLLLLLILVIFLIVGWSKENRRIDQWQNANFAQAVAQQAQLNEERGPTR